MLMKDFDTAFVDIVSVEFVWLYAYKYSDLVVYIA